MDKETVKRIVSGINPIASASLIAKADYRNEPKTALSAALKAPEFKHS